MFGLALLDASASGSIITLQFSAATVGWGVGDNGFTFYVNGQSVPVAYQNGGGTGTVTLSTNPFVIQQGQQLELSYSPGAQPIHKQNPNADLLSFVLQAVRNLSSSTPPPP